MTELSVTEEMIEAGIAAAEAMDWADVPPEDVTAIYLAMKAKEQSPGDDVVERVASAIWDALLPFDSTNKMQWDDAKGVARAAINALKR